MSGLEASEIVAYVRMSGVGAFERDAKSVAKSVEGIEASGGTAMVGLGKKTDDAHKKLTKLSTRLGQAAGVASSAGRSLTQLGVPLAALGVYSVKSSNSFGQAMKLLQTQAGESGKRLGMLGNAVQAMAPKVGATPLALAQALYPIESIGLRGANALKVLKAAAIGSAVGLDSLENTSDAVTTAMATHMKGAGGPLEAMSLMDRAIGLGKMHLSDLTESLKSGLPALGKAYGLSFPQMLATISALTREGIPADSVTARTRLTLSSMISPTNMGASAMAAMGLSHFQLANDLHSKGGLIAALKDLKQASMTLPRDIRNAAISDIFGKSRGAGQIASLLNALPQMQSIYGSIMGTTPSTLMQHFQETQATSAFKYQQLQDQLDRVLIQLGNTINKYLLPLLVQLIPDVAAVVKWFGELPAPVKKFLVEATAVGVVLGPLALALSGVLKFGSLVGKMFGVLAGSEELGAMETGVSGVALGFARLIPTLGLAYAAFKLAPAAGRYAKKSENYTNSVLAGGRRQRKATSGAVQDYLTGKPSPNFFLGLADKGLHAGLHAAGQLGHLIGIHGLANGGFLTSGGSVVVGERGPELLQLPDGASVRPLDKLGGSLNNAPIEITLNHTTNLDGKVIAMSVNRYNRGQQNRR